MSFRDSVVFTARQLVGRVSDHPTDVKGNIRKGWDVLKEIIDVGFETPWNWSPANLQAIKTPGVRLSLTGRGGVPAIPGRTDGLHWCGIFAAYCLRTSGLAVKWRSGVGIVPSEHNSQWVWKFRRFVPSDHFDVNSLEPGDVAGIPEASHHFVVVNSENPGYVEAIAGNGSYQRIEPQRHSRDKINVYYRIVREMGTLRS